MVSPIDSPVSGTSASGESTPMPLGSSDILERSASAAAEGLKRGTWAERSMRDRMTAWNQLTDRSLATSRNYVREHPLQSAMMAMAAGMLLRRVIGRGRVRH